MYIYGANRLYQWSISGKFRGADFMETPTSPPRYRTDFEKGAIWLSGFPNFQLFGNTYLGDHRVGRRVGVEEKDTSWNRMLFICGIRNCPNAHLRPKSVSGMVGFGHPTFWQYLLSPPAMESMSKRTRFCVWCPRFPTFWEISTRRISTLEETLA